MERCSLTPVYTSLTWRCGGTASELSGRDWDCAPTVVGAPKTAPSEGVSRASAAPLITVRCPKGDGLPPFWASLGHRISSELGTKLLHWLTLLESFVLHLLLQTESRKAGIVNSGCPPRLTASAAGFHFPSQWLQLHWPNGPGKRFGQQFLWYHY